MRSLPDSKNCPPFWAQIKYVWWKLAQPPRLLCTGL